MLSKTYRPSNIAIFDTNIYGILADNPSAWKPIANYLVDNDAMLALSDINVLELSDVPQIHDRVARFLLSVPSVLFKPGSQIIEEEVLSYGTADEIDPLLGPLQTMILEEGDPIARLSDFLCSDVARKVRLDMTLYKPQFERRIRDTFTNFEPIVLEDKFTEGDAQYYAFRQILLQSLTEQWPETARVVLNDLKKENPPDPIKLRQFRGLWICSIAQFYRYYLHKREPESNDYGDFLQLIPLPYCYLAVLERSLCDDLAHIKRHDPILQNTEIHNIGFLREISNLEF